MSCNIEEEVYRVPLNRCGIVDKNHPEPSWQSLDWNEDDLLDFDEMQEEYDELFSWEKGGFHPALRKGNYLDFVLYSQPCGWGGWHRLYNTNSTVFYKIVPDIDIKYVHHCEYSWYDGVDAPDVY